MKITLYLHSSKESNYEKGMSAGLAGRALQAFKYAGYGVEIEYDVDESSGLAVIVKVDGRELK